MKLLQMLSFIARHRKLPLLQHSVGAYTFPDDDIYYKLQSGASQQLLIHVPCNNNKKLSKHKIPTTYIFEIGQYNISNSEIFFKFIIRIKLIDGVTAIKSTSSKVANYYVNKNHIPNMTFFLFISMSTWKHQHKPQLFSQDNHLSLLHLVAKITYNLQDTISQVRRPPMTYHFLILSL